MHRDLADKILRHHEVMDVVSRAAWRFYIDGYERNDLMQIGRQVVWERVLQKHPVTYDNVEEFLGLMYTIVANELNHKLRDSFAEKRFQLTKARSFSNRVGIDYDEPLESLIASPAFGPLDTLLERERLVSGLRRAVAASYKRVSDNSLKSVIIILVEILVLNGEETDREIGIETFKKYGLDQWLERFFHGSVAAAMSFAYPGIFFPPGESSATAYFGSKENVIASTHWLVEEKLGIPMKSLTIEEIWRRGIAQSITINKFRENGLSAIIKIYMTHVPVLRMAYPDKWLPWSFAFAGKWNGEGGAQLATAAIRWLLETYLKIDPLEVPVTRSTFTENGLAGLLRVRFKNHAIEALEHAYPEHKGRFKQT